jgi:signal transduction histidine kinase
MSAGPDPAALQRECEALRARLAEQDEMLAELNRELAETNNGVVALYAELDDRAEQLAQASDLKSRFLSYMSHEFRTPLGTITSLAHILLARTDGPLTEEQERQMQFVRTSAAELTEMVDDLLDLAKVEAGRITISPEWFEMVDLFSALRGMFRPIVDSEAVDLVFEQPDDVPRLYTDHKKLSQILRNFVSNALKFTPKGSVRVGAQYDGAGRVAFTVTDTGIGIAPEHAATLFNDFVQIASPLQRRLRGTGLGLSLSRKLAVLLGGEVGVESEVGAGSTFTVTVPVRLPGYAAGAHVPFVGPGAAGAGGAAAGGGAEAAGGSGDAV